jgi:hypothetical protein
MSTIFVILKSHSFIQMFKLFKKESLILFVFITVFILLRTVNFTYHLNFSGDQAMFATKALEIYRTHQPVLIGPPVSINLHGREIFQGPMIYYETLFFLVLGGFDPVVSSYLFMIFCALMIFPLYFGIKMLFGKRSALIITSIYVLLPYYIEYTRFLWNPNFQFSLIPVALFLMGLYKKKQSIWALFGLSVLLGIMLQYHYQFVLVILGIFIYYAYFLKMGWRRLVVFILGSLIGFSPLILFEVRNHFYNLQTALLFVQNRSTLDRPGSANLQHYYLSLSLMIIVLVTGLIHKKIDKIPNKSFERGLLVISILFAAWATATNFPKPNNAFWAGAAYWNYPADYKVYQIVKKENLTNYNITNSIYDTLSLTPKYLLKKDNVQINYEDYWHNRYLFLVEDKAKKNILENTAYEVWSFKPSRVLKSWDINQHYKMYLLERSQLQS